MKNKNIRVYCTIALAMLILMFVIRYSYKQFIKYQNSLSIIDIALPKLDKITPVFESEGIQEIAFITMIKNEDDIIFENLAWHYSIGFRKFIIVDNMSTDQTKKKIHEFINLTNSNTIVFVIEDPVFEYIQYRIMTGAYDFARSVWPEVKWIFPVDADEFLIPAKSLKEIIKSLPRDIDKINITSTRYYPTDDYDSFSNSVEFYKKLHYRTNKAHHSDKPFMPKVAVRSIDGIKITQGNHSAEKMDNSNLIAINGDSVGLYMYEYPIRSIEHANKKFLNGLKVNKMAKNKKIIADNAGTHWDEYEKYIEIHKEEAAMNKFKESFISKNNSIDDPLPINKAIEILRKQTNDY